MNDTMTKSEQLVDILESFKRDDIDLDMACGAIVANVLNEDAARASDLKRIVSCPTVPERKRIADTATDLRDKELRELNVYNKGKFTPGDVGCILKALEQELNN